VKIKPHELAKKADGTAIFLPPYSPDLNIIEKYRAQLECRTRKFLPLYYGFYEALCGCFHVE